MRTPNIKIFSLLLGVFTLSACGTDTTLYPHEAQEDSVQELNLSQSATPFCPSGFTYSSTSKLCVSDTEAVGPFPQAMVSRCVQFGGGEDACKSERWSKTYAVRIRGTAVCPLGTGFDTTIEQCTDGTNAFGPFAVEHVERCKRAGGGKPCEGMRWSKSLFPPVMREGSLNRKVADFYSVKANYDSVYQDVLKFYPDGRTNGCVAFMSTALRRVGVNVPLYNSNGGVSHISLVTLPFSNYLKDNLGWKVISNAKDLKRGDVVFTTDAPGWPGYPAHTYMYHSWANQSTWMATSIDNRYFMYARNVFAYGDANYSPFKYALRSPN